MQLPRTILVPTDFSEGARRAAEYAANLATHGRRGLARALLGSVAEKVVRTSPVPVLTLHAFGDAAE